MQAAMAAGDSIGRATGQQLARRSRQATVSAGKNPPQKTPPPPRQQALPVPACSERQSRRHLVMHRHGIRQQGFMQPAQPPPEFARGADSLPDRGLIHPQGDQSEAEVLEFPDPFAPGVQGFRVGLAPATAVKLSAATVLLQPDRAKLGPRQRRERQADQPRFQPTQPAAELFPGCRR